MEIKNKIYITSGVSAIFALILIVTAIFLFNAIVKESNGLKLGKDKIAVLEKEFNDIRSFKSEYASYGSNLDKAEQLFVDSSNPVSLIKFLEKTASDYGLKLIVSVPSFSHDKSQILVSAQLSLEGDFPDIIRFVQSIENSQYLIQIKNLNIGESQANDKNKVSGQLKANLSIQVLAK